jgi:hypothetical protein
MWCSFLADSGHYRIVGDAYGVGEATVCTIVHQVTAAIVERLWQREVCWPDDAEGIRSNFSK